MNEPSDRPAFVLVRIRCANAKCRRVLAEVREAPRDSDSVLKVGRCPRCDLRDAAVLAKWAEGLGVAGPVAEIPWRDLREPIAVARRTGKPSDVSVRFVDQAQKLDGLGDVYPLK